MSIQYTISDTELAGVRLSTWSAGPTGKGNSKKGTSKLVLFILLILILAVWTFVLYHIQPYISYYRAVLTGDRAVVTAITYDEHKPCAVVLGKVVYEGDSIQGYQVVNIYDDHVDLVRDGNDITEHITQKPSLFGFTL